MAEERREEVSEHHSTDLAAVLIFRAVWRVYRRDCLHDAA